MIPLSLDGCRAWHHPGHRRAGVVLCSALGIEELCARQSYVLLAKMLEERGVPVLRFDYFGTCDSAGDLGEPDLVGRWLRNIERAAQWLEQNAGVTELTFVGLRFGAALATAAAAARGGVARLALLAPVQSGRVYARELQLASQVLVTMGAKAGASHNPGPGTDVAGFVFPPDLANGMRAVDVARIKIAPAAKAFVATLGGADAADAVSAGLSGLGVAVTREGFPDYELMMVNPTSARPCLATMRRLVGWIASDLSDAARNEAKSRSGLDIEPIAATGWRETADLFPVGDYRCGILCEPDVPAPQRPCVLLLNGGRDSHVGWARGTVELARQLAASGIASLRFDLTSVADSQPDTSGRRAKLYATRGASGMSEVRHALNLLEQRGYRRFAVFGSCSGAYLALKAGLADRRIDTVGVRNIQRLVWRLDDRILFPYDEWRNSAYAGSVKAVSPSTAVGPASGSPLGRVVKGVVRNGRRSIVGFSGLVSLAMFDRWRSRRALTAFAARGGRVLAVYSAADPGRRHLDELFGKDGEAVAGDVTFRFVDDADHNFTSAAQRRAFGDMLIGLILRREADRGAAYIRRHSPQEHFPTKWLPGPSQKMRQDKESRAIANSEGSDIALVSVRHNGPGR